VAKPTREMLAREFRTAGISVRIRLQVPKQMRVEAGIRYVKGPHHYEGNAMVGSGQGGGVDALQQVDVRSCGVQEFHEFGVWCGRQLHEDTRTGKDDFRRRGRIGRLSACQVHEPDVK